MTDDARGASDTPLADLADRMRNAARGDTVSVAELIESVGARSFVPCLMLPALVCATPLSGIPGVSIVCGVLIAIISAEILLRFDHVRLPGFLTERKVPTDRMCAALDKARPVLDWVDRHTRKRLSVIFHRPFTWLAPLVTFLTGCAMPFLEVVPTTSSIAAIAVLFISLALLTRDGVFFLLALCVYAGMGWLVWSLL